MPLNARVDPEKSFTLIYSIKIMFRTFNIHPLNTEKIFKSGKLRRREFWQEMSPKLSVFVSVVGENGECQMLVSLGWLVIEAQHGDL